jgi:hypothetical protein
MILLSFIRFVSEVLAEARELRRALAHRHPTVME